MKYSRMNPEVKAIWLDALTCEKFTQHRGSLRGLSAKNGFSDTEFCPLGLLQYLGQLEGVVSSAHKALWTGPTHVDPIAEWSGLTNFRIVDDKVTATFRIITMNDGISQCVIDGEGPGDYHYERVNTRSYRQIAKWIDLRL